MTCFSIMHWGRLNSLSLKMNCGELRVVNIQHLQEMLLRGAVPQKQQQEFIALLQNSRLLSRSLTFFCTRVVWKEVKSSKIFQAYNLTSFFFYVNSFNSRPLTFVRARFFPHACVLAKVKQNLSFLFTSLHDRNAHCSLILAPCVRRMVQNLCPLLLCITCENIMARKFELFLGPLPRQQLP